MKAVRGAGESKTYEAKQELAIGGYLDPGTDSLGPGDVIKSLNKWFILHFNELAVMYTGMHYKDKCLYLGSHMVVKNKWFERALAMIKRLNLCVANRY